MSVPLVDLRRQYEAVRDGIEAALLRVARSGRYIGGPEVEALEGEIAACCGVEHGVAVSSGSDALLASLMALGVGPGDEVVTSVYSFFATAGAIVRLGARPVFVDIDPLGFCPDPAVMAAAVTDRTRALLPVHMFGRMTEMDPLLDVAGRRGIPVVEDAAQALGAADGSGHAAAAGGTLGCLSFFPTKNLGALGDGGMVLTRDAALAEALRSIRAHGASPKYHHPRVGGNFRLDAIQAAVLRAKLPRLADWTAARRRNASRLGALLAEAAPAAVSPAEGPGRHVWNQFVVRVPRRDAVLRRLREAGIGCEVYYPVPFHLQPCLAHLGYAAGDFPEAERASRESLALPVFPEMTEEELAAVACALGAALAAEGAAEGATPA
jgi:dTDP-4-amino-4,6-dideoxygalactose transaminase